jgi:hypothetical protein
MRMMVRRWTWWHRHARRPQRHRVAWQRNPTITARDCGAVIGVDVAVRAVARHEENPK